MTQEERLRGHLRAINNLQHRMAIELDAVPSQPRIEFYTRQIEEHVEQALSAAPTGPISIVVEGAEQVAITMEALRKAGYKTSKAAAPAPSPLMKQLLKLKSACCDGQCEVPILIDALLAASPAEQPGAPATKRVLVNDGYGDYYEDVPAPAGEEPSEALSLESLREKYPDAYKVFDKALGDAIRIMHRHNQQGLFEAEKAHIKELTAAVQQARVEALEEAAHLIYRRISDHHEWFQAVESASEAQELANKIRALERPAEP